MRYELVDLSDLMASHDADLRVNPAFPPNGRRARGGLQKENP
jgi:2-hydroxychromene-2-carboxylate isomerase